MKQIVTASTMYIQDYDEALFGHIAGTRSPQNPGEPEWAWGAPYYMWHQQIFPYVNNLQLFTCPSLMSFVDAQGVRHDSTLAQDPATGGPAYASYLGYGMNYWITYFYYYLTMAEIERPTETIWYTDCKYYVVYPTYYLRLYPDNPTYGLNGRARLDIRHNDGANVGFLDGHAKWMNRSTLEGDSGPPAESQYWWGR